MPELSYNTRYITPFQLQGVSADFWKALSGKEILITGSQGMLGSAMRSLFTDLCLEGKINPKIVLFASRKWSPDLSAIQHQKFRYIENSQIPNFANSTNVLIHTASPSNVTKIQSLEILKEVNSGFIRYFDLKNLSRVIYISSGEIYRGGQTNEDQDIPSWDLSYKRNWYPAVKHSTEQTLLNLNGVNTTIVRLFHTFGPGVREDDGRAFADILWAAAKGLDIELKSNGEQIRTFLYLADAVSAICKIIEDRIEKNKTYNLGSENPLSIFEFANLVANVTKVNVSINNQANFPHSPNQIIIPDTTKVKNLGWYPRFDLDFAVSKTIEDIKNSLK